MRAEGECHGGPCVAHPGEVRAPDVPHGSASRSIHPARSVATLWGRCREAEAACKRLELELRAERDAHDAEREACGAACPRTGQTTPDTFTRTSSSSPDLTALTVAEPSPAQTAQSCVPAAGLESGASVVLTASLGAVVSPVARLDAVSGDTCTSYRPQLTSEKCRSPDGTSSFDWLGQLQQLAQRVLADGDALYKHRSSERLHAELADAAAKRLEDHAAALLAVCQVPHSAGSHAICQDGGAVAAGPAACRDAGQATGQVDGQAAAEDACTEAAGAALEGRRLAPSPGSAEPATLAVPRADGCQFQRARCSSCGATRPPGPRTWQLRRAAAVTAGPLGGGGRTAGAAITAPLLLRGAAAARLCGRRAELDALHALPKFVTSRLQAVGAGGRMC